MRQVLFDLGVYNVFGNEFHLRLFGYGFALVLGFLTGIFWAQRRARRAGENPEVIGQCGLWALVGGVIGARIAYVAQYHEHFVDASGSIDILEVFNIAGGGLIYFGGLAGGTLTVLIFLLVKRLPARRFIDILAPSLMLGLAFGRVGCLLNGCCWGGPVEPSFWASIEFPMVSKPLVMVGENPYGDDQGLCPTYAHQYWQGTLNPDDRLLNAYRMRTSEDADGQPIRVPMVLPPGQLHGRLVTDQLTPLVAERAVVANNFAKAAGEDGRLSRAEWDAALAMGSGLLGGSESWDEAVTFSRYEPLMGKEMTLDSNALAAYLVARRDEMILRFDENKDGEFSAAERQAVNAYLQADLYALLSCEHAHARKPAQILGICNGVLLALLLAWYYRQRRAEGRVFALMLILYPPTRFMLESIRHDNPGNLLSGDWTHNQINAILMVIVGITLWWWFGRRGSSAGGTLSERMATTDSAVATTKQ